jgi:hypothetical protein
MKQTFLQTHAAAAGESARSADQKSDRIAYTPRSSPQSLIAHDVTADEDSTIHRNIAAAAAAIHSEASGEEGT